MKKLIEKAKKIKATINLVVEELIKIKLAIAIVSWGMCLVGIMSLNK